jgi:hypothetical protein
MPTVRGKKFPYTKSGVAAAKRYASRTGMKVNKKKKKSGY